MSLVRDEEGTLREERNVDLTPWPVGVLGGEASVRPWEEKEVVVSRVRGRFSSIFGEVMPKSRSSCSTGWLSRARLEHHATKAYSAI